MHARLWYRNDILKARQLGISTYVAMLMLDMVLFRANFHAGIIDKSLPDAQQKLAKMRFAWEHLDYLPEKPTESDMALAALGEKIKHLTGIERKNDWKPKIDARDQMGFTNGSDVRIGTNLRGGTLQFLHVSELAHVSHHAPWRAKAIKTGAINTVGPAGVIVKESTHEGGKFGVNYELTKQAMDNMGKELSTLDFKFFFFSWFDHEEYALEGKNRCSEQWNAYFLELEQESGVLLSDDQKRWYVNMAKIMGVSMKQEYPSTPEEAFTTGDEGSIYGARLIKAREEARVGLSFDIHTDTPTFTAWDLGMSDHTSIWLVQVVGTTIHWIDHYTANQQPLSHYVEKIRAWQEEYGVHYTAHLLPHDAARRDAHGKSYVEHLAKEGIDQVRVVPRTTDIWLGINTLRELIDKSCFHANTMNLVYDMKGKPRPSALERLESYRSKPSKEGQALSVMPLHDEHSHTADAARTFAEAWDHQLLYPNPSKRAIKKRARMH